MAKQRLAKRRKQNKTLQATRQVAAFLTLTIAQETDDGDVLLSHLPLPYGVAALTWLAGVWLALWPTLTRVWMEAGWLVEDAAVRLNALAGTVWAAAGAMEMLAVRFYLAVSVTEVALRALWFAVR